MLLDKSRAPGTWSSEAGMTQKPGHTMALLTEAAFWDGLATALEPYLLSVNWEYALPRY